MPRLAGALAVLWPALMLAGTLPVLLVEISLSGMAHAPVLDTRRLRAADAVRAGPRLGPGVLFFRSVCDG